jgi:hypothetical protein
LQQPDSDQYHSRIPWKTVIEHTRIPSPLYPYVINLVVSLSIMRDPSVFMNVSVREHCALNN